MVVTDRLRWRRSGGQPLETVGRDRRLRPRHRQLTVHTNSLSFTSYLFMVAGTMKIAGQQAGHPARARRAAASARSCSRPSPRSSPGMCSREVGRPVMYLEDRVDNISNCDHHGSDRHYDVSSAVMRDGTMRGIDIDTVDDYGAYIQFGVGHHGNALAQVVGPYRIDSVAYRVRAALTNKNQQGAYRGFGSEVNNWMLEQMVDKAARELGIDPVRDPPAQLHPASSRTSSRPATSTTPATTTPCWTRRSSSATTSTGAGEQAKARAEGRYIGIGLITAQERSVFSATEFWFWFDEPGAPVTSMPESVTLKVDATGGITATLYSCAFWGNSPETMVAQLVAEEFDCDPHDVSIVYQGSRNGLPATGPGRLADHGDARRGGRGRHREDQGQGAAGGGAPAGGRPGRPGVVRRRVPGQGRARAAQEPRPRSR